MLQERIDIPLSELPEFQPDAPEAPKGSGEGFVQDRKVIGYEFETPWCYPKQREAIFDCKDVNGDPARYSVIEASTKAGKTAGCIIWFVEQAYTKGGHNRNFWWVAPVYAQAKIAYRRMKHALDPSTYVANETELTIKLLTTGSVMWFKTGDKADNLYGEDVYAAVVDEASRCKEEAWIALRSTLTATRGPVRIIGNVKGRNNWHYKIARKAEAGAAGYSYHKMTAYDAVEGGVLTREEIEDAKLLLSEAVFNELYLAIPSDDQGNPFGYKYIAACIKPMSELPPVAIGIDLAKSNDWAVVIALDRNGDVCGFERWQGPWSVTEERIKTLIGSVPTLIDSTGVGDPIVESIQRVKPNVEGFVFTAASKQRIMEGLTLSIQNANVGFPEGHIRQELDTFEYVYKRTGVVYSAPEGLHDDCVCALALAVEKYRRTYGLTGIVTPGANSRISPWAIGGVGDGNAAEEYD